jgi:hypothetical protein
MMWNIPNTVIVDIDGTLSNCEHRVHWVRSKPKNWPAFNRGMKRDTVHEDIVWMLRTFHAAGCTILIASGRGEEDREVTETWLRDVAGIAGLYSRLYMRPARDYRSDDIVKGEILDHMLADGFNPTMAIDDRQQVVDMFRSRGLRVLQCARGDF